MPSGDPHPGELLGVVLGNYRVLSKLGQGGMGEVYVGRHEQLGHRVAVKVLQLELSRKADMVRRFFNEAQAATAIRNPGIVHVFDFGTTPEGRAYVVTELLEGQSLGARLQQRRRADDRQPGARRRQHHEVLLTSVRRGQVGPANLEILRFQPGRTQIFHAFLL